MMLGSALIQHIFTLPAPLRPCFSEKKKKIYQVHLAWEFESCPNRFFEIPRTVNTAFHHVLPAVSWGSLHVRPLLPEHEQLSCLQSNYRTRLCLQKLPQPAGLDRASRRLLAEAVLSSRSSRMANWHSGETRNPRAGCL